MKNKDLKDLYKKYNDEEIAKSIIDIVHKLFNEKDFTFYDYFLRIAYELNRQVKDGILTKENTNRIHKEIGKLSNNMINDIIEDRCDKCCSMTE